MLMGYEEKLKEGLLIELEVNEGDYPGKYRTKVEALHQNIITIGVPIHDGQFVPLREGTKISVYFLAHQGNSLSEKGLVIKTVHSFF